MASAAAVSLKDLVAGANKEGKVKVYWSSTFTQQYKQRFQDAFNKQYGTKVTIQATASGGYTADAAKVVSEASAGQPPSWDIMLITDAQYATMNKSGVLTKYDWTKLFNVPAQAVDFSGGAYTFSQQIVLPAYNTKLVQGSDIPKTWEDLLNPKWSGKIGVNTATHHWGRLSFLWEDAKTTDYVTKLAAQKPKLGATPEMEQRLELGEISIAATDPDDLVRAAQKKGAPVASAQVQPVIVAPNMAGVLKRAVDPAAAALFAGFLATKQGQDLWEQGTGQSSVFVPGSTYQKLIQGKQYINMTPAFLQTQLGARTKKYAKILGFR